MATFEEALVAVVGGLDDVTGDIGDRFFPVGARQGVDAPYITFLQVSGPGVRSLAGHSNLEHPRYQLNCWDKTALGAAALADKLRAGLDGWRGTAAGLLIKRINVVDRRSLQSEPTKNAGVAIDITIWHQRS